MPGATSIDHHRPAPAGAALGVAAFAALALTLTGTAFARRLGWVERLPAPVAALSEAAAPFASFNAYGLFAVMTTERPEILVEGSRDGETWLPYTFRYKPGPLERAPASTWLHMPRLDWQMWFAALGTWRENPWYLAFVHGLLTGSAPVQSLLAENPFGAAPPLQIRSTIWRYRFATDGERAQGRWWTRELAGAYCPVLELDEQGELRTAP